MINALCILPECYADTRLIQIILGLRKSPNHQHSKGDVINKLEEDLYNYIAVGIIDEDKNKGSVPQKLTEYKIVKNNQSKTLELRKHKDRNNYIVIIKPELERFLLRAAKDCNINPVEYNLSSDIKELSRITKSMKIGSNNDFTRFIKSLVKAESPDLLDIKIWIDEIFQTL